MDMRSFGIALACIVHISAAETGVFTEGSQWETVVDACNIVEGIAQDKKGIIYLTDVPDSKLIRLHPDGRKEMFDKASLKANGLAVGPDGNLYSASMAEPAILSWNLETRTRHSIALPTPANDLAITDKGSLYCTWGAANAIYQLDLSGTVARKVAEVANPNGITLSHDGRELWVGEFSGSVVRAFPIQPDAGLGLSRVAFTAKVPADGKGLLDGMTPLPDGRLLVASALGLQILSPSADPILIPNPTSHRANYVRILSDSTGQRWIYVAHVKSVLRRKTLL
jgi:gluconolactonase